MQVEISSSDRSNLLCLAPRGYDPVYGARPLKRVIQQNITNKLATMLLSREQEGPVEYEATIQNDEIQFAEVVEDVEAWAEEA